MTSSQIKGGAYSSTKRKKRLNEKSLDKIISSALSELHSKEARKYLISLAKDGSLEQHQTRGNITDLAEKLLQKLREGNSGAI